MLMIGQFPLDGILVMIDLTTVGLMHLLNFAYYD